MERNFILALASQPNQPCLHQRTPFWRPNPDSIFLTGHATSFASLTFHFLFHCWPLIIPLAFKLIFNWKKKTHYFFRYVTITDSYIQLWEAFGSLVANNKWLTLISTHSMWDSVTTQYYTGLSSFTAPLGIREKVCYLHFRDEDMKDRKGK